MQNGDGIHVLALAPPEFERDFLADGERMSSVNSDTPYALLSTLSPTFQLVRNGVLRVLNWQSPEGIRDSVFLMHHWQGGKEVLEEKLRRLSPGIVLIGTFAMNFPGAIAAATMVRELLPDALIVLGGRHVSETFWSDIDARQGVFGDIREHAQANPLRLMQSGKILPVFDLVVSGQGDMLIPSIIEAVQRCKNTGISPREILKGIHSLQAVPGYGTIGRCGDDRVAYLQPEKYIPSSVDDVHSPYIYAGSDSTHFSVFEKTDWTAHVHSDSQGISGNTCTQNCSFCSEASGKQPLQKSHEREAADRLFARFQDIIQIAKKDGKTASIFVEDSILCGGHIGAMERFCELLEQAKRGSVELPREWGCQFTVPMILSKKGDALIRRLRARGLSYIYFGLESAKPEIARTVAKSARISDWTACAETAIANLTEMGIKVGTSNIFCMGESHVERMKQLQLIKSWQEKYGNPVVYSLNLQTVHPGEWDEKYAGPKYDYIHWGLDAADPRSPILQKLFGEAGTKHLRYPDQLPSLQELQEIEMVLCSMHNKI